MCLIIVKEQIKSPDREILKKASEINPHGLGIFWIDTQELQFTTSEKWQVLLNDRPYIAHFRYATVGKVNASNVHPFLINSQRQTYLFQNGTIPNIGDEQTTDTEAIAGALKDVKEINHRRTILSTYNCRFIEVSTLGAIEGAKSKNFVIYNRKDWHEKDGNLFSKANCFINTVAVYGTLKKGYSNSHLLNSADFIGDGKTANKYRMYGTGIPYMHPQTDNTRGNNNVVEVYQVTDSTLKRLDILEGHPNHYERKETPIKMKDGTIISAQVYFCDTEVDPNQKTYSEFKQSRNTRYNYGYGSWYNTDTYNRNKYVPRVNRKPVQTELTTLNTNPQEYCKTCGSFEYMETYGTGAGSQKYLSLIHI